MPQLVFEHSDAQARRAFANGGELPVRKPRKGLLSFEGAPASEAPPPPGPTGLEPGRASGGATPRAPPSLKGSLKSGTAASASQTPLSTARGQKAASRSMSPATLPLN